MLKGNDYFVNLPGYALWQDLTSYMALTKDVHGKPSSKSVCFWADYGTPAFAFKWAPSQLKCSELKAIDQLTSLALTASGLYSDNSKWIFIM